MDLAKKPFDRARLDVVVAACAPGAAIVVVGGELEIAGYLESRGARVVSTGVTDRLGFSDGELGGAVAVAALGRIRRERFGAAVAEIARVLLPGAALHLVLERGTGVSTEGLARYERTELEGLFEAMHLFDRVRIESRRPYPGEPPIHRLYVTAERRAER
jgi:hypothetical protein